MSNNIFKICSNIHKNTQNPNTIFKRTLYNTKYTNNPKILLTTHIFDFSKNRRVSKNQLLFWIISKLHNSYLVFFLYFVTFIYFVYFVFYISIYNSVMAPGPNGPRALWPPDPMAPGPHGPRTQWPPDPMAPGPYGLRALCLYFYIYIYIYIYNLYIHIFIYIYIHIHI